MKEQEVLQTASESRASEPPGTETVLDSKAGLSGWSWEGYSLDILVELLDS